MTKRLILIVFLFISVITTAQERTTSPYSFYGVGLNTFRGTVENKSMGGISIFSDSIHLNLQNPAGYGRLRLTNYSVAGSHSRTALESATESGSARVTTLDYLAIGIPTNKFGFGFGLIPYSAVGYNIIDINEEAGTAGRFSGSGGINKVFLGAGFELTPNISIGAEAHYNFGNIENSNIHIRQGLQFGTREINSSDLRGFTYKIGLDYERMLSEKLEIRLGAHYAPQADLRSDNERELATVLITAQGNEVPIEREEIEIGATDLTLPASVTIGAGIGQPLKWFVGAEYENTGESNFSNRSFSVEGASYSSATKMRIGGFYIPEYNSLTSYFSRVVYRGGFRMEETGLSLDGEAINELGISFGVGLPAGGNFSNLNVGFEYGQRGTTDSGLIKENFFNVMISLSLSDRWFIKRRFE